MNSVLLSPVYRGRVTKDDSHSIAARAHFQFEQTTTVELVVSIYQKQRDEVGLNGSPIYEAIFGPQTVQKAVDTTMDVVLDKFDARAALQPGWCAYLVGDVLV